MNWNVIGISTLPNMKYAVMSRAFLKWDKVCSSHVLYVRVIGRGVNREGFNFKLATVKTCSTWPLLNKYALKKKIWSGSSDPYIAYGKIENLIFFSLQWSKCIPINLKGTL